MRYQVPQFIDTEDKIGGLVTLKQFFLIIGAGGACAIFYFILGLAAWLIFFTIIMGGTLVMAFVRVNGRPMSRVATAAVRYLWRPQTYVWTTENPKMVKSEAAMRAVTPSGFSLESLVSGLSLKSAWREVQVNKKSTTPGQDIARKRQKDKYEVVSRVTGDLRVAKRVDYR